MSEKFIRTMWAFLPLKWQSGLINWWSPRSLREKKLIFVGAVITLVIMIVGALDLFITQYTKYSRQLPALRVAALQSDYYAKRARNDKKIPTLELEKEIIKSIASLDTAGDNGPVFSSPRPETVIKAGTRDGYRIDITDARPSTIFSWLENVENSHHLTIFALSLAKNNNKLSGWVTITR